MKKVKKVEIEVVDIDSMKPVSIAINDSIVKEDSVYSCTEIKISIDRDYEYEEVVFDLDNQDLSFLIEVLKLRLHNNE